MSSPKARDPDPITGHDFRVDKPLTRKRAMREKCVECCGGSRHEVKHCKIVGCALWPWRLGSGITQSEDGTRVPARKKKSE